MKLLGIYYISSVHFQLNALYFKFEGSGDLPGSAFVQRRAWRIIRESAGGVGRESGYC